MAEGKTLDLITQATAKPSLFSRIFLQDPSLSEPKSRAFTLFQEAAALRSANVVQSASVSDPSSLTPTAGQVWIVAPTGAGAWAGLSNYIVGWTGTEYKAEAPVAGWMVYSIAQGCSYVYTGSIWRKANKQPVTVDFRGTPDASEFVGYWPLPWDIYFPADFSGSVFGVGTNPSSSYAMTVDYATTLQGSSAGTLGTVTISNGGVATLATSSNTEKTVAAGNFLRLIGNASADASIADIAGTFAGYT